MVQRNEYMKQLIKWKDEQVIKVVTGIRRCGKSTLLEMYQDYLKTQGIGNDQIVSINFPPSKMLYKFSFSVRRPFARCSFVFWKHPSSVCTK